MLSEGKVGIRVLNDGAQAEMRLDKTAAQVTTNAHGQYCEAAMQGKLFSVGMGQTALSANTITLTATTTPIVGVWNPLNSDVNLVLLKAKLQIAVAGNSAVAPGAFVWAVSTNNGAISTGLNPLNRKTLQQTGSRAKGYNISTALTGLTTNLVIQHAAAFGTMVAAQGATASPIISGDAVEEFDGSIIIPPGGVLALLNTISTTTVSVASMLLWEEIPL